jgi:hypothetical protein
MDFENDRHVLRAARVENTVILVPIRRAALATNQIKGRIPFCKQYNELTMTGFMASKANAASEILVAFF